MKIHHYEPTTGKYNTHEYTYIFGFIIAIHQLLHQLDVNNKTLSKTFGDSDVISKIIKEYYRKPFTISMQMYKCMLEHTKPEDIAKLKLVGVFP